MQWRVSRSQPPASHTSHHGSPWFPGKQRPQMLPHFHICFSVLLFFLSSFLSFLKRHITDSFFSYFSLQDHHHSCLYDGPAEVPPGPAELHAGDRELCVCQMPTLCHIVPPQCHPLHLQLPAYRMCPRSVTSCRMSPGTGQDSLIQAPA